MYVQNVVGTGSDTTSTTDMYDKDFTYRQFKHIQTGVVAQQVLKATSKKALDHTRPCVQTWNKNKYMFV